MYSPKIDEELIPRLYRLRKLKKIPMTRLVNGILENALLELEKEEERKGNILAASRDIQCANAIYRCINNATYMSFIRSQITLHLFGILLDAAKR